MSEDADAVAEIVEEQTPAWSYAENVAGEGEAPDWFKADKYQTVADQAKAYKDLEGRFGSFTGAPDEYEFSLSEQLTEQGIELDKEDPLITSFIEMAKESNMSQDMANKLVNMYVEGQYAGAMVDQEAEEKRVQGEMKALGDSAEKRISNVQSWLKANMDPELMSGFEDATTTAAGVKALEALIAKTRNAPIESGEPVQEGKSHQELQALKFAKDDNGNLRMQTDPEYRKMVRAEYEKKFGTGDNRIIIG